MVSVRVGGVLYVMLLYCCSTAVHDGCGRGWVMDVLFISPLVLQRTPAKHAVVCQRIFHTRCSTYCCTNINSINGT